MRKASRKVRMILSMLAVAALLGGSFDFQSLAAEANVQEETEEPEVLEAKVIENADWPSDFMPYTMLADCAISVSGDDEGMHIDISTGSVGTASVLGVKDVEIYKKNWLGQWKLVATSSGGETYNGSICGITILYANAVKGATYKITCVHYGDVNGYIEDEHDSGEFVFTY